MREASNLNPHDRSLDVGHPIVVAKFIEGRYRQRRRCVTHDRGRNTVAMQLARMSNQVGIRASEGTTLSRGDPFASVEAECRHVGEAPRGAVFVSRSRRARSIFEEPESVLIGNGTELIEIGWLAEHIDGDNSYRSRCDRCLDGIGVDRPDIGSDIDEDRARSRPHDRVSGGRKCVIANDDLVTGPRPEHDLREMEGRATITGGQHIPNSGNRPELVFERRTGWPRARKPPRPENLGDRVQLFLANGWLTQRYIPRHCSPRVQLTTVSGESR